MSNADKPKKSSEIRELELKELLALIEKISKGEYSDDIMAYTRPEYSESTRKLAEAIGMMMVKIESREYHLQQLLEELKQTHQQVKKNIVQSVLSIAKASGARDEYTQDHARRVSLYAKRIAVRLGLSAPEVESVRLGARLHDIGKIGFSDKIFHNEDTSITEEMLEEIKAHPVIGYNILKDLDFLGDAMKFVYYHHERIDGNGYPEGLKGDEIPLGARIISVADCFDAMTTDRPYQKGMPKEKAFEILRKLSGTSLEPHLVEVFIEDFEENGIIPPLDKFDNDSQD